MKGFALANGDLSITKNNIDMIEGNELKSQTIACVLSTNKGEWIFDPNEGIDFGVIFGKQQIARTTTAKDSYYQEIFAATRREEMEQAERLRKRLSGE